MQFDKHDRFDFPDYVERVTAGAGGEALLIFGGEKTALYDCGMAFCAKGTIANIEKALEKHGRNTLDYILISHSHYDHIGALPYIKQRWPNATVCGAQKAKDIFDRPNARKLMAELGTAARDNFSDSKEPILAEGFNVDRVVAEGDRIFLGEEYFLVIETKGHTDCCLTFLLEPDDIMFLGESMGILDNPEYVHTTILKSYYDAIFAAEKCRAYKPKHLVCSHYGMVPESFTEKYWEVFFKSMEAKKDFICDMLKKKLSPEEMLKAYDQKYWTDERAGIQPKEAFLINGKAFVNVIIKEFGEECAADKIVQ